MSRLASTEVEDLSGDPGPRLLLLLLVSAVRWRCRSSRGEEAGPLSRGTLRRVTWGEW